MTEFIERGMARIRQAMKEAPSHLEMEAGFEAMLRHMSNPDDDHEDAPPSIANQASLQMMHARLAQS